MKTNEFAKISKLVNTALIGYRNIRKQCNIPDDGWHSRSIEGLAKPFIKGYFTLAVVGKVSSGKSTFINALLGAKNLLPTGHDQTTCGITYIEYGECPEVTIVFGDGHTEHIKDDIKGKIKPYVAIPEKYHNLPVNTIDDMILGGFDYNKIWEARKQIEEETLCPLIDSSLLKDYVNNRKIKDIAVEVHLKYPFNEELKGWKVIDTPGIGAIGGIEIRTRHLLSTQKEDGSREVDAIIFLQDGSQTLDQTDSKKFIKEQLDTFTNSDKERLFYVLTHSSSSDFLNHKESKLKFIQENYGDKMKCLTYADSLLYTFINELGDRDLKYYDDFEKPEDWEDDEWDVIMQTLYNAQRFIKKNKDSFNHDTMYRNISEWAHFVELKNIINDFAKEQKQKTLFRLLNLIATDYLSFIKELEREKNLVDGNIGTLNDEISKVEDERRHYNELAQKVDYEINIDKINEKFAFINSGIFKIDKCDTIPIIRTEITNLFNKVQETEKLVFQELIKHFSDFFKENDFNDIILESIDFDAIEKEATDKSRERYVVSPSRVITHCCSDDERIPATYRTRVNAAKKLLRFRCLALTRARQERDEFLPQLRSKVERMKFLINEEMAKKINIEINHFEYLKTQLDSKQELKAKNDALIANVNNASKEILKLAENYGYKF